MRVMSCPSIRLGPKPAMRARSPLSPRRDWLTVDLKEQPEGFVQDGQVVRDRPHAHMVPGFA